MTAADISRFFSAEAACAISSEPDLLEIRVRAETPVQLVTQHKRYFTGGNIERDALKSMILRMMDHSYYAKESELSEGYFTIRGGCRVGVCGTYSKREDGSFFLRAIGSLCIRIAREIPGCAEEVVRETTSCGLKNTLIISPPGMGKTTLLRDTARIMSEMGYAVGIADERNEIAACINGVPSLNVGTGTDVIDGLPKQAAMERIIRTMAPHVLITDEIGGRGDVQAIREAVCRGVAVIASAHASSVDQLREGALSELMREKLFQRVILLGGAPGRIAEIWRGEV